jgi:hypothetical protein
MRFVILPEGNRTPVGSNLEVAGQVARRMDSPASPEKSVLTSWSLSSSDVVMNSRSPLAPNCGLDAPRSISRSAPPLAETDVDAAVPAPLVGREMAARASFEHDGTSIRGEARPSKWPGSLVRLRGAPPPAATVCTRPRRLSFQLTKTIDRPSRDQLGHASNCPHCRASAGAERRRRPERATACRGTRTQSAARRATSSPSGSSWSGMMRERRRWLGEPS